MDRDVRQINTILQIIFYCISIVSSLSGIYFFQKYYWYLIPITFIVVFNIFCSINYVKKIRYINFIEFLFNNDDHRFTLLPKFRIFLEKKGGENKLHLTNLSVTYIISKQREAGKNIADLKKEYVLTIPSKGLHKNRLEEFHVYSGNDFAKEEPNMTCSINEGNKNSLAFTSPSHESYERGIICDTKIDLSPYNLFEKENKLKITQTYTNSFDFDETPVDTLILLPQLFGTKIDKIDFTVKLEKFSESTEFKWRPLKIVRTNMLGGYTIRNISDGISEDKFCKKVELRDIKPETAYYFRISINSEKTLSL